LEEKVNNLKYLIGRNEISPACVYKIFFVNKAKQKRKVKIYVKIECNDISTTLIIILNLLIFFVMGSF